MVFLLNIKLLVLVIIGLENLRDVAISTSITKLAQTPWPTSIKTTPLPLSSVPLPLPPQHPQPPSPQSPAPLTESSPLSTISTPLLLPPLVLPQTQKTPVLSARHQSLPYLPANPPTSSTLSLPPKVSPSPKAPTPPQPSSSKPPAPAQSSPPSNPKPAPPPQSLALPKMPPSPPPPPPNRPGPGSPSPPAPLKQSPPPSSKPAPPPQPPAPPTMPPTPLPPPPNPPGPAPPAPIPLQLPPVCSANVSCKGRCKDEMDYSLVGGKLWKCYCDPECQIFNDCCADFDLYCPKSNRTISNDTKEMWHCEASQSIWVINRCPSTWPANDVSQKCIDNSKEKILTAENFEDATPVLSKDMITYRNRHCAKCHGVQPADFVYLTINFTCSISPPKDFSRQDSLSFLFTHCSTFMVRPYWTLKDGQPERRCLSQVSSCLIKQDVNQYVQSSCEHGSTRLVYHPQVLTTFKNWHCAKCYYDSLDLYYLKCGAVIPPTPPGPGPPITPFSILMDFSNKKLPKSTPYKVQSIECRDWDKLYDTKLELCRPKMTHMTSLPKPISKHFQSYRVALWVTESSLSKTPMSNLPYKEIRGILTDNFDIRSEDVQIKEWQSVHMKPLIKVLIFDLQETQANGNSNYNRYPRSIEKKLSVDALLKFTKTVSLQWRNETFNIIKSTVKYLKCIAIKYYSPGEYTVLPNSSNVYINETGVVLSIKDYFANHTKLISDSQRLNFHLIPVDVIAVCTNDIFECLNGTLITLANEEYVVLLNNSVFRKISGTVYNQGEYSKMENGSVAVCDHYSKDFSKKVKERLLIEKENPEEYMALAILSFVGLSLSVICLVFFLVTYSLFAELRTLPGINLMNLSSALLVAHLLWLIGSALTGSNTTCVSIAVILHFAFLASFMWMSIIAYSTWKAFSSNGGPVGMGNDKEYRKIRILKTLIKGWIPALVFVLICVSLDQSEAVPIQYGGTKGCWINNGTANLSLFVIPVMISIIWNAVFFGFTVRAINQARKQASMAKRENHHNYAVYIKITVLMGFTWIFGVLGSFVSRYFMYAFVVLSTLQGVYIAVSFTFTRRVINLYKQRFMENTLSNHVSSSTTPGRQIESKMFDTRL